MFVSGLPFLITLSRRVRYVTVQFVPKRTAGELASALKLVIGLYRRAGLICQTALMDGEFEKVKERLINTIEVNVTARNEHVPEIERKIRHVKERARCIKADVPYKIMPSIMIKRMVLHAVLFMNAYVDKQGISDEYSPREIILRWQLDWRKHCKYHFGAYGQAYDDPNPAETNTQAPRSRNIVCVGPMGNMQGSYYFLDLDTKAIIKRRKFTELPIPDSIIRRIERWGKKDRQDGLIRFCDRNNDPFDWTDEQGPLIDDNAPDPEPAAFPDIPAEMPGVVLESSVPAMVTPPCPTEEERMAAAIDNAGFADEFNEFRFRDHDRDPLAPRPDMNITHNHLNIIPAMEGEINQVGDDGDSVMGDEHPNANDSMSDDDIMPDLEEAESSDDDKTYIDEELEDIDLSYDKSINDGSDDRDENTKETRSGRKVKPPLRYRDNIHITVGGMHFTVGHMHFLVGMTDLKRPIPVHEDELGVLVTIMTQMSLKEGLRRFGKKGRLGAYKEMKQLHNMHAFFPCDPRTLSSEERKSALSSLIFLKEKKTGEVKGRTCVIGAPQREYIRKEDAASPTVATDSVFITGAVDAFQSRDVAFLDLPGAFLHTPTDEKVSMTLRGELCELMCLVDPKLYRKHVCHDKKGNRCCTWNYTSPYMA
ncbi:hypothetical protein ACHAW6_002980 [Cyclotella cf. meneghiniana]